MFGLRNSKDLWLLAATLLHASLWLLFPPAWGIALLFWWNANSVSHNFIHNPLFQRRWRNTLFSAVLSLLLGVPQRLWRERHLAHHAHTRWQFRGSRQLWGELLLVGGLWGGIAAADPNYFLSAYLPGLAGGLLLAALQGTFEHWRGVTVAHYGRPYNWLFFNDGYHVEHHGRPRRHWSELPQLRVVGATGSSWPAVVRWLGVLPQLCNRFKCTLLDSLEKWVLRSPPLQRWLLRVHRVAFERLLESCAQRHAPCTHGHFPVVIVGGGLFPRTAVVLRALLPETPLIVVDANDQHLRRGEAWLRERQIAGVQFHAGWFVAADWSEASLWVLPLAYRGELSALDGNGVTVVYHDWLWKRSAESYTISWLLLKKLCVRSPRPASTSALRHRVIDEAERHPRRSPRSGSGQPLGAP